MSEQFIYDRAKYFYIKVIKYMLCLLALRLLRHSVRPLIKVNIYHQSTKTFSIFLKISD